MVNESGDYGEGKGQNQDLDPGSGAYREDGEEGNTRKDGEKVNCLERRRF